MIHLVSTVSVAPAAEILLVETGQMFTAAEFSVGNASDVFIDLQCIGEGTEVVFWFQTLPTPVQLISTFDQTITSFDADTGFLRVFINFIQDPNNLVVRNGNSLVFLSCFRASMAPTVNFRPGESHCYVYFIPHSMFSELVCKNLTSLPATMYYMYMCLHIIYLSPSFLSLPPSLPPSPVSTLFFTGDLPDTIPTAEDLSPLCTNLLPDLPTSSVTVISDSTEGGVSYSYCEVESARGTFRSASVVVGERNTGE